MTLRRGESKHITTENHQFTKEGNKIGRKEQGNYNNNNMALVSPYISVTTLNVSGLTAPIKSHSVLGWLKDKITYMLPIRDSL